MTVPFTPCARMTAQKLQTQRDVILCCRQDATVTDTALPFCAACEQDCSLVGSSRELSTITEDCPPRPAGRDGAAQHSAKLARSWQVPRPQRIQKRLLTADRCKGLSIAPTGHCSLRKAIDGLAQLPQRAALADVDRGSAQPVTRGAPRFNRHRLTGWQLQRAGGAGHVGRLRRQP